MSDTTLGIRRSRLDGLDCSRVRRFGHRARAATTYGRATITHEPARHKIAQGRGGLRKRSRRSSSHWVLEVVGPRSRPRQRFAPRPTLKRGAQRSARQTKLARPNKNPSKWLLPATAEPRRASANDASSKAPG